MSGYILCLIVLKAILVGIWLILFRLTFIFFLALYFSFIDLEFIHLRGSIPAIGAMFFLDGIEGLTYYRHKYKLWNRGSIVSSLPQIGEYETYCPHGQRSPIIVNLEKKESSLAHRRLLLFNLEKKLLTIHIITDQLKHTKEKNRKKNNLEDNCSKVRD